MSPIDKLDLTLVGGWRNVIGVREAETNPDKKNKKFFSTTIRKDFRK